MYKALKQTFSPHRTRSYSRNKAKQDSTTQTPNTQPQSSIASRQLSTTSDSPPTLRPISPTTTHSTIHSIPTLSPAPSLIAHGETGSSFSTDSSPTGIGSILTMAGGEDKEEQPILRQPSRTTMDNPNELEDEEQWRDYVRKLQVDTRARAEQLEGELLRLQQQMAREDADDDTQNKKILDMMSQVGVATDTVRAQIGRNIKRVGECDGLNPEKTLKWLRKLGELTRPIEIAQATAEGPLAKTVASYSEAPWAVFKKEILRRHVSPVFEVKQREALLKHKQGRGTWLAYDEEFSQLLSEAYPDGIPSELQEQVIKTYVNGLASETVGFEILKQEPETINAAREIANAHQKYSALMSGTKTSAALEGKVNTAPPSELTALVKGMEALQQQQHELQSKIEEVKATPVTQPKTNKPKKSQNQGPRRGQPRQSHWVCYRCGNPGHIAKNCRAPSHIEDIADPRQKYQRLHSPNHYNSQPAQLPYTPQTQTPTPQYIQPQVLPPQQVQQQPAAQIPQPVQTTSMVRCERCKRDTHMTQDCRAPAPSRPCYCGGLHWNYDCPEKRNRQQQAQAQQFYYQQNSSAPQQPALNH